MLLIEKVVKLLDDFHFNIFREYVKNISVRSYYPLALIDVISRDISIEQNSEQLCIDTYGLDEVDEKVMKKFFQLGHYTFKLIKYLSKNYPNFLQSNIPIIQHCINTGQLEKANKIADVLLEVSNKLEDFETELKILKTLIQQGVLLESAKQNQKYHQRIKTILNYEIGLNDIFEHLHTHFRAKGKALEKMDLQPHLDFFDSYSKSKSLKISIISRFCACFAKYYKRDQSFYTPKTFQALTRLEEDLEKYNYIVFPYLFILRHRIDMLKLNYQIRELDANKILEAAAKIIEDSEDVLPWNSYVNLPEIFSIAIQTSHYVSNYFFSYQENHLENFPYEVKEAINILKTRCVNLLSNPLLEEKFTVRYINLTTIYAGLLVLGDHEDIKKSINTLEGLLIFYQQIPFHPTVDAIFLNLTTGAFCLKDYEKLNDYYRRYKKATKGKAVNKENDLTIEGFYFAGKWLETKRNQYVKKLALVLKATEAPSLSSTRKMLMDIIEYYKIPI